MKCDYACRSPEHGLSRRAFLGGVMAGASGACAMAAPGLLQAAVAEQARRSQKRILTIFLHGGVSQLESWDPKPNTATGGPFRAIPTSVPGVHISELLPQTALQMHRLAIVRSLNTHNADHGKGQIEMVTGRKKGPEYPHLGAVASRLLTPERFPLPGHILITGGGSSSNSGAYLGPKYGSVTLTDGQAPQFSARPSALSEQADARRNGFRAQANAHFAARRRSADTDAYTFSYDQAAQLMARREVFDVSREPARDHDRYGKHDFGQHCLLARRLLENDVPFVQVNHSNYDTHFENFDYHIEQLGEFDQSFATLLTDLAQRELLKDTLVIVMSEFGRTPKINRTYGRDHWGTAWSVVLGGAGIHPGAVVGKTNADGTAVVDREVDHGELFHTYLQAVGLDSKSELLVGGRNVPIADPAKSPIRELLV